VGVKTGAVVSAGTLVSVGLEGARKKGLGTSEGWLCNGKLYCEVETPLWQALAAKGCRVPSVHVERRPLAIVLSWIFAEGAVDPALLAGWHKIGDSRRLHFLLSGYDDLPTVSATAWSLSNSRASSIGEPSLRPRSQLRNHDDHLLASFPFRPIERCRRREILTSSLDRPSGPDRRWPSRARSTKRGNLEHPVGI
jgi:hypothetical protein